MSSSNATRAAGAKRPVRRISAGRRALFILITLGVLGTVILVMSELVVRIVAPQPVSWLDFYRRHPSLPLYSMQAHVERLIDTGETRWNVFTDQDGHRIVDKQATTTDTRPLMLALGDSFTFGNGLDYAQSYLGRLATASNMPYRTVNTAVGGYGPVQYADTLDYEIAHVGKPELVLVGTFLGNDFHDSVWDKNAPVNDGIIGDDGGARAFIAKRSHLYRLFSKVAHSMVPGPTNAPEVESQLYRADGWQSPFMTEALRKYEQGMARIASTASAQQSQLLVVIIPARQTIAAMRQGENEREPGTDASLPVKRAIEVLDRLHIAYVDLSPVLAKHAPETLYFAYDGHFTEQGSKVAADEIAKHLPVPRSAAPH